MQFHRYAGNTAKEMTQPHTFTLIVTPLGLDLPPGML